MSKVQCYVYDITQGMAASMSQMLVGKQIDYVPHTGIIVFGKEYFFGGGPCVGVPGQTVGCPVYKTLELGETSKTVEELDAYIASTLSLQHNEQNYNLLHHNCNHYADDVAKFLLDGKGLPSEIVNIAAEALDTPQGQQMKVMIENMEKNMRASAGGSGLNPFAGSNGSSPAMPVMPAGMPAMPAAPSAATATSAAEAPATNSELEAALADVAGNDKETQRACLSLLVKIMENVEKNPVEAKFRKIKLANPAFAKKVVGCNGGVEIMFAAGWMPDTDPDGEDVWLLGDEHANSQSGPLKALRAALEKLGPAPGAPPAAAKPKPGIVYGTDAPPVGQGYGNGLGAPAGGMGGMPGMGGLPGMGGGAGGLPAGLPPGMANHPMMQSPQMQAAMQNPAMMQQVQQMMQDPAAMQQMMSNPQVQQMMNQMGGAGRGGF